MFTQRGGGGGGGLTHVKSQEKRFSCQSGTLSIKVTSFTPDLSNRAFSQTLFKGPLCYFALKSLEAGVALWQLQ